MQYVRSIFHVSVRTLSLLMSCRGQEEILREILLPPDTNVFFQLVKVGLMCGFFCLRANNFSGVKSELSIVFIVKLKSLLSTLAIIVNICNIPYSGKYTSMRAGKYKLMKPCYTNS
jgi:hypothetical protein